MVKEVALLCFLCLRSGCEVDYGAHLAYERHPVWASLALVEKAALPPAHSRLRWCCELPTDLYLCGVAIVLLCGVSCPDLETHFFLLLSVFAE